MPTIYFDPQTPAKHSRTGASIAAMKHASTRFLIGHCLFICDDPRAIIPSARRKWLSLARLYDKKRSMTFDADRSVKYTYLQLQMQLVRFTTDTERDTTLRTIFVFCSPQNLPEHGLFTSIYNLTDRALQADLEALTSPHGANYITYADEPIQSHWKPRQELNQRVEDRWAEVVAFLKEHSIDLSPLTVMGPRRDILLDKTLDTLLNIHEDFLALVTDFRSAYEQARPFITNSATSALHDLVLLLAYRVQSLSAPHEFAHFLELYEERDTLALLNDSRIPPSDSLTHKARQRLIDHHTAQGNHNIAQALQHGAHGFEAACHRCLLPFFIEH